jgi:hypothetical protein
VKKVKQAAKTAITQNPRASLSMGGLSNNKNTNRFLSVIKRFRVTDNKFAEYEIMCQLRASGGIEKEIVYKWSVWRRFSSFSKLYSSMVKSFGWQMNSIEFPSSYPFVFFNLTSEFLENRKNELAEFWQKILSIDKVTEFDKHHCSQELKLFLDVDEEVQRLTNEPVKRISDDFSN